MFSSRVILLPCVFDAGVTMLLTLSVFQVVLTDKLPPTSDEFPLIGKSQWLLLVFLMITCWLLSLG